MSARLQVILAIALTTLLTAAGCSSTQGSALDPKAIEQKYGLSGGYVDKISTANGMVDATIIPTTLKNGRKVQLVIPHEAVDYEHQVFIRDGATMTPVEWSDPSIAKDDAASSQPQPPAVELRPAGAAVATPATPAPAASPAKKRSTKKEALIIGGSAGAGAAIGAAAGGGKGAGIGALSGGVAGLVYDLATKNK
jgi:hypothetical protein